jgi:hypothetical protein
MRLSAPMLLSEVHRKNWRHALRYLLILLATVVAGALASAPAQAGPISWSISTSGWSGGPFGYFNISPVPLSSMETFAGESVRVRLFSNYGTDGFESRNTKLRVDAPVIATITDNASGESADFTVNFWLEPVAEQPAAHLYLDVSSETHVLGENRYTLLSGGDGGWGTVTVDRAEIIETPEPAGVALAAVGLLVTAARRRGTRNRAAL